MNGRDWSWKLLTPTVIFLGLASLILTGLGAEVSATVVTINYNFERPEISKSTVAGQQFDRIRLTGAPNGGKIGHPSLPSAAARILLPYNESLERIEIIPSARSSLGSNYLIEPVGRPFPLSVGPTEGDLPKPDPTVYALDTPYPAQKYDEVGRYFFRGYQILILKLYPVEYIPATGELYYNSEISVNVHTRSVGKGDLHTLYRGFTDDENLLGSKVDNPELAVSYLSAATKASKSYDMMIITTADLVSSFQPLKDYHDTTGILTEIHTLDMIGSGEPADIRNYIRDKYLSDGIQFVLIGGDDNLIPAQDMFVISWEGADASVEYDMPSDLYFGCLDGPWDFNGNGLHGEPYDGEGGGDVDLMAEAYVGRASVDNAEEADRFVNKTIQYLSGIRPYLMNTLLAGEYLGFGGLGEYGGYSLDLLVDGSNPYGIPSNVYDIDKLYDRDWPGNYWPRSELTSRINNGVHILNHFGHGSISSAMKMYSTQIQNYLTNADQLFFLYSQACLCGHFDGTECWAEYMHVKGDDGTFAMITNARYGWGTTNSNNGPSQRFNRQFWDAIFNPMENKPELARANQDSKEDLISRINESCMRWCTYELNLLGDPTIVLKIPRRLTFTYPFGLPRTVSPNDPTRFEVIAEGTDNGTPVSGSGQLHYSLNGAEEQTVALTELSANHYEVFLPTVGCGEDFRYYLSAEEELMGVFNNPRPDKACQAISATVTSLHLDDNFETDRGWIVSGNATEGQWERGIPAGGGDRGDPPSDYDGSGCCYLTGNSDGNSDIEYGSTYLTSPAFDATAGDFTQVHYARWYSNDAGEIKNSDDMNIFISNDDGETWTLVECVGPSIQASGGWYEGNFWVSDFVEPTDRVRVQFEAASELGDQEIVEAAVDQVYIASYQCNPYVCGDANGDKNVNIGDGVFLLTHIFQGGPAPEPAAAGDCNCDTSVNIGDAVYILGHIFLEGLPPCYHCPL